MKNKFKCLFLIFLCSLLFSCNTIGENMIMPDETQKDEENIVEIQVKKQDLLNIKKLFQENETLTIHKTLYCNIWHTECDVMGDEYWVKDEISNPKGIKSKEGHRKDHCGAIDSWYIYLDKYGKPYAMLEMKAGSTNNLIPLPATFYTDDTYTELRDPATIEVGERIYWTTENKGQVWHHTGVTRLDIPIFEFIIDDKSYFLSPGEEIKIDIPAGDHTIIEKYDKEYIINDVNVPFSIDKDSNVIINVNIAEDAQVELNFENIPKNMPEPPKPPEIQPITETETETELMTETETENITEVETQITTETEIETESETEIPATETEFETETESESETEISTETEKKQTEKQTEPLKTPSINKGILGAARSIVSEVKKAVQNAYRERQEKTEKIVKIQSNTPKTGDNTPIENLVLLIIICICVIAWVIIFFHKYHKK